MHKINLNIQANLFGKPVTDQQGNPLFLNKEIAHYLYTSPSANSIKMKSICLRLYEVGDLELDQTDLDYLKAHIGALQGAPSFITADVLEEIAKQVKS